MTCLPHQCFVLEMSNNLKLDVYFPQFAPFLLSGNATPAFAKLCAIGTWEFDAEHALEASLCKHFGVKKQADWPLAPIALMGEAFEQKSGYWFLVHPVHFVLQRDFFTLGEALRLSAEERDVLLTQLNQHYAQDGLRFVPSKSSDFCYLHIAEHVDVSTYLLAEAIGRDVGKLMPYGKDGMRFQAVLNEVQMLLHDHLINQTREQQGLLVVNSLWFSGGGSFNTINPSAQKPAFQLFASGALSAGLAKWAGIACRKPERTCSSLKLEGDAVLVVDDNHDLERDWFAPLLQMLKKKELKTLRCHFDVHGMTFTLTVKSLDTWKFWRKPRPVTSFFHLVDA
jgi:hypothetical protein